MTVFYVNSPQSFGMNKILDAVNCIYKFINYIKEKYAQIKSKQDKMRYEKEVKEFLNFLDSVEEMMDTNPLFSDRELFDFMNVKEITSYILKDSKLFEEHFNFLMGFFKDYDKILMVKFEAINSFNGISYEKEYKKFKYGFNRKREFFYAHIYEHLGIYDDMIDEYVNALGGDLD